MLTALYGEFDKAVPGIPKSFCEGQAGDDDEVCSA
jgi:hypothetical protein